MCKKIFPIAISFLILLTLLASNIYAAPEENFGIIIWPVYWQYQDPWADDPLNGNYEEPLRDYGCAVTSLAMLLEKHRVAS